MVGSHDYNLIITLANIAATWLYLYDCVCICNGYISAVIFIIFVLCFSLFFFDFAFTPRCCFLFTVYLSHFSTIFYSFTFTAFFCKFRRRSCYCCCYSLCAVFSCGMSLSFMCLFVASESCSKRLKAEMPKQ